MSVKIIVNYPSISGVFHLDRVPTFVTLFWYWHVVQGDSVRLEPNILQTGLSTNINLVESPIGVSTGRKFNLGGLGIALLSLFQECYNQHQIPSPFFQGKYSFSQLNFESSHFLHGL